MSSIVVTARDLTRYYTVSRGAFSGHATLKDLPRQGVDRYGALPALHGAIRRQAMLAKQQLALGFQYPPHFHQGLVCVRNGAQGEGTHHGIEAGVRGVNTLSTQCHQGHRKGQ